MLVVCRGHYPVSVTVLKKENKTIHLLKHYRMTRSLVEVGKKTLNIVAGLQPLKCVSLQFSLFLLSLHVCFRNT